VRTISMQNIRLEHSGMTRKSYCRSVEGDHAEERNWIGFRGCLDRRKTDRPIGLAGATLR